MIQRFKASQRILLITPLLLTLSFAPLETHAQTLIKQIITTVGSTLRIAIGVLLILATVVFLWGMVLFIARSGDPPAREKSKGIMTWGIIGLTVMAVAWGVVNLLFQYFGIPSESPKMSPPPIFNSMFSS